jgi:putative acetyltransferase
VTVRHAQDDDLDAVSAILKDAFGRPDEARLVQALWGSDELAVALVNEVDRSIVAVGVLTHLSAPEGSLALGPIAVASDRRGRGFGKALIGESVSWARRGGHAAIFVLGQPPYYERFGFSVEAARPFRSPYPPEFMMAFEVRPGALADALAHGGEIRYPAPFAALG